MRKLLFFSNNKNKTIEIKKIFKKFNLEILSLSDLNIADEPKENGRTFEENAKIKSDYGFNKTGFPCFADDSGICIESLNWKPGVLSKRYLNNFKSKHVCFETIINSTKKNSKQNAYFKTSISLTVKNNQNVIFNGKISGKISDQVKGGFGFGYDPIFIPKNYNKTLAELSTKEKNEISHRSIAVTKLINFLTN
ncbi:RdgB/HAM1 family non-canonical purine NTP pyrophosphatase [Pelagibacteraceae bacterium]|nr:RdgB/HAM1 family non-canonical purine NTP pyrophosphatase [Pelagibacteraceae bacterium]